MQNLYNYNNLETYNLSLPNNLPNVSHILYPKQVKYENIDTYDEEIEYIASTGTQFINLNFGFDNTDEVYTTFGVNTDQTSDKYIVSPIQWNNNNNRFAMGIYQYYCCGYGNSGTGSTRLTPNTTNDGKLHDWQYVNKVFTITDLNLTKNCTSITWGGTTANLRLFYGYNANTKGKIKSYKHIKNGVTVCDLIAVRKDGVGYLFDKVSGKLFGNSGTGDFILGPDIYITNGLIFWLDGINKGSNDNSWIDLIGGIVFTGTDVTSTEYGWSFNGSTSYFLSDSVLTGTADYTVEVCFKPNNTNTYCLFMCNKNTQNNVLFYKNGNNITFSQYNNTYPLTLSANQKYSVSLNLDNGLLNGTSVSKNSGTDYWTGTNNFYIGRRSAGAYFSGEIYSIRIYNRKLSQSEQLTNFNIDNNRFNLGL